jgi:hypothetical protein
MSFKLEELDAEVALRFARAMSAPPEGGPTRPRVTIGRVFGAIGATALWWLAAFFFLGASLQSPFEWLGWLSFLGLFFGAPFGAARWMTQGVVFGKAPPLAGQPVKPGPLTSDSLRKLLESEIDLTPSQHIYGRSVLLLLEMEEAKRLTHEKSHALLDQLNRLVSEERALTEQEASIRAAINPATLATLNADIFEIQQKLATTRDPMAREALEKSLDMCETRLTNSKGLLPLAERIDAQKEAVEQTLASLESALTRMHLAPAGTSLLDDAHITNIQDTVSDISRKSRAVEDAVTELATISLRH